MRANSGALGSVSSGVPAGPTQAELEAEAQLAWEASDYDRAMACIIDAYGRDLLGFLASRLGDVDAAQDAFSDTTERLWRHLPALEWRNGLRAYCYAIARSCAVDAARSKRRGARRNRSLAAAQTATEAIARARTGTPRYMQTGVKQDFRRLREQLSDADQTLLVLRLDRGLDWRELAVVMTFDGALPGEAALTRESARLRQRFRGIKAQLRRFAEREGMLDE